MGAMLERWNGVNGGTVERWNGGTVERWNGGTVERWNTQRGFDLLYRCHRFSIPYGSNGVEAMAQPGGLDVLLRVSVSPTDRMVLKLWQKFSIIGIGIVSVSPTDRMVLKL